MRKLLPLIVGTCLYTAPTLALAAPEAPQEAAAPAAAAPIAVAPRQAQTDVASDKARYSAKEREKASAEAQDYQGGDTVVIGASAATAILAVLLLLVLI